VALDDHAEKVQQAEDWYVTEAFMSEKWYAAEEFLQSLPGPEYERSYERIEARLAPLAHLGS
jgi:hypothetical protein